VVAVTGAGSGAGAAVLAHLAGSPRIDRAIGVDPGPQPTGVGARCAAASAETAICLARSQFTGPLCWDSICCSAANSGALPARSSGMPMPGMPKLPNGMPGTPEEPDPDEPDSDESSGSSRCGPNPNGTSVTSGLLALPCSPR